MPDTSQAQHNNEPKAQLLRASHHRGELGLVLAAPAMRKGQEAAGASPCTSGAGGVNQARRECPLPAHAQTADAPSHRGVTTRHA